MAHISTLTIIFMIFPLLTGVFGEISCKNEKGEPVDWFIVYKLPRLSASEHPLVKQGLAHYYMDVNSQQWTLSDQSLNSTQHAIYHTLQQIYHNHHTEDVAYVLYNDELPGKGKHVSMTHGHTKGDVCFDKSSGFWLVHSLPKFPDYSNGSYVYPDNGLTYGQTFLCVTYPYKYLDIIGKQLLYTWPYIYDYNLPSDFPDKNPNMALVVQNKHVTSTPWQHQVTLTSLKGQKFVSFAKYTTFDADLYDGLVAPSLGSGLLVDSWQNGQGNIGSNCTSKYYVYNVKGLQISDVAFTNSHDHSKWAVTIDTKKTWICIGDINRQREQFKRAGGTVCAHLPHIWQAFNASITNCQQCPSATFYSKLSRSWTKDTKTFVDIVNLV